MNVTDIETKLFLTTDVAPTDDAVGLVIVILNPGDSSVKGCITLSDAQAALLAALLAS